WWYHHHVYRSGYTYKDWLIGYYTDRTTRNYFGEITYDLTPDWRVGMATWQEKHYDTSLRYLYRISRYQLSFIGHFSVKNFPFTFEGKLRFNNVSNTKYLPNNTQLFLNLSFTF
ncbi:hypothetical protein, partial [Thermodesulfatator indicus]